MIFSETKILLVSLLALGFNVCADTEKQAVGQDKIKVEKKQEAVSSPKKEKTAPVLKELIVQEEESEPEEVAPSAEDFNGLKIKKIILDRKNRNYHLTDALIRNSIPYRVGEEFALGKTSKLIRSLYDHGKPFGYFEQVSVAAKKLDDSNMHLYIITREKPGFYGLEVKGNKGVSEKDIKKKLNIDDIYGLSKSDLPVIKQRLVKLYRDSDYHNPEIDVKLASVKKGKQYQTKLVVNVVEGTKSRVRRVIFKGNESVPAKRLRNVIFTREDWLLGALTKAGSYRPENLSADKHFIRNYYHGEGYLDAKVLGVDVKRDPKTKQFDVTFTVEEGGRYKVSEVGIDGGGAEINEAELSKHLPLLKGDTYSEKNMRDSSDVIRTLWGEHGYVFAEVSPIVIPNLKKKTVSVTFSVDLGNKVHVNRINVIGNKKTHDRVIRRKIIVNEGEMLTKMKMDLSKDRVMQLDYFDRRNGVNWKIHRIDDKWADLDLIVKERKTGRVGWNMGYGGSVNRSSPTSSLQIGMEVMDTNLFGEGLMFKVAGTWSKQEWTINSAVANPALFDRPILGRLDFHITKSDYGDELKGVDNVDERRVGASSGFGFVLSPSFMSELTVEGNLAFDDIHYEKPPTVNIGGSDEAVLLQTFLNKRFQAGGLISLSKTIRQDFRNSSEHPSRGYQWSLVSKLGLAVGNQNNYGFGKIEFDAGWYTALIGDHDLVFGFHTHFGIAGGIGDKDVPFREIFHIGGPSSVRGFEFGQIGPIIKTGGDKKVASIGSKKSLFVNAELVFPITKDLSLKGAFFYDGGAGWDTPGYERLTAAQKKLIGGNSFDYRHAVGFGVRMTQPQPVTIDWGFKLDRRPGEPHMEVHFSTHREF